jgi:Cys-rich protein (TIGR01571 family)
VPARNAAPPRNPAVGPANPSSRPQTPLSNVGHPRPPPGALGSRVAPASRGPPHLPQGQNRQAAGVVAHQHVAPSLPYPHNQQPSATRGMAMGQQGGGNRRGQARPWSNGLCDVDDPSGTCCLACFCPCIVYGQNKARLKHLLLHGASHPQHGGSYYSDDCFQHGCLTVLCGIGWALQISTRKKTRLRYNIAGTDLEDCGTSLCCGPCALTQESKEMGLEETSLVVGPVRR